MATSDVLRPEAQHESTGAVAVIEDPEEWFDSEDADDFHLTPDGSPIEVEQGLFIGSFLAELNWEQLKARGITHVLQVAECAQPSHPEKFHYKTVHVQDSPAEDLVAHFGKCFSFIDDAIAKGGACLVHCMAGVSRSSAVCIGYIMNKHRLGYEDAFRRVHAVRSCIMPNEGFRKQLKEFQKLDYDLSKWKAWRHIWREDPLLGDPITILLNHTPVSLSSSVGSAGPSSLH